MKNYFKYMAILALGIVSCEPELENSIEDGDFYTSGEADFSNYVALGNSLTAGYADGALYLSGQQNSFPSILAEKFSAVQETGEFIQPLVNDNAGGLLLGGNQITENRFVLAVGANGYHLQDIPELNLLQRLVINLLDLSIIWEFPELNPITLDLQTTVA